MTHSQEQDIAIDKSWLNDNNNSEPYSRKGKGKERNVDSYVDLQSPDVSTERFDASVYPPANDELEETRRVEENLRRWEIADRQRRKAARESINKGLPTPSLVGDVSRRTSLLWTKKRTQSSSVGGIKNTSSSSRDSVDFLPLTRVPTSPSSASPVPSDPEETPRDPFSNPQDATSPFSDFHQVESQSTLTPTTSTLPPNSDSLTTSSSSTRPPPPKPLNLPPPRTPPPIVASPEEQSRSLLVDPRPVKWWHEWLCGCGEGPDRGGDYQAGRTNPFE